MGPKNPRLEKKQRLKEESRRGAEAAAATAANEPIVQVGEDEETPEAY